MEEGAPGIEVRLLESTEAPVLRRVAPGVFDGPPDPRLTAEFLGDDRHHLAVALDEGLLVGMASAVHYVHPDKPPELWINEVGVAPSHRRRGLGRRLVRRLLDHGRTLGCRSAWVLAEGDNTAAAELYRDLGGVPVDPPPALFELDLGP